MLSKSNRKRYPSQDSIPCGCGCGRTIDKYDYQGRQRRYVAGHNSAKRPPGSPPASKTCLRCKRELALTTFYADPRQRDGRRGQCKRCENLPRLRHPEWPPGYRPQRDSVIDALQQRPGTCSEIVSATGLSENSVRGVLARLKKRGKAHSLAGVWALGPKPETAREQRAPRARVLYPCDGKMLTAPEIAKLKNMSVKTVWSRIHYGIPLEQPVRSGATPVDEDIFCKDLAYVDDKRAQAAMSYLKRSEPLLTADEIYILFNSPEEVALQRRAINESLGRGRGNPLCSREEARALHAWLCSEMRDNRGKEAATLDEIAGFLGVGRERVRQIEVEALEKSKRFGRRMNIEKTVVEDLRFAEESRRETYAERIDLMGSDELIGTAAWNDKTSHTALAKRSGRAFSTRISLRKAS